MKHRDDDIITDIFRTEQNNLYRLACYKIGDPNHAADVVQDILSIWMNIPRSNSTSAPSVARHIGTKTVQTKMKSTACDSHNRIIM